MCMFMICTCNGNLPFTQSIVPSDSLSLNFLKMRIHESTKLIHRYLLTTNNSRIYTCTYIQTNCLSNPTNSNPLPPPPFKPSLSTEMCPLRPTSGGWTSHLQTVSHYVTCKIIMFCCWDSGSNLQWHVWQAESAWRVACNYRLPIRRHFAPYWHDYSSVIILHISK